MGQEVLHDVSNGLNTALNQIEDNYTGAGLRLWQQPHSL